MLFVQCGGMSVLLAGKTSTQLPTTQFVAEPGKYTKNSDQGLFVCMCHFSVMCSEEEQEIYTERGVITLSDHESGF